MMHSSDLTRKKQELETIELAFHNYQQWMKKREVLDKAILELQEGMAHAIYQPPKPEKQKKLQQLKQAQHELDQLIDQIEHLTEINLEQYQMQFFQEMWELYPDRRSGQEMRWKEKSELETLEREMEEIEKILLRLLQHLQTIIQTRQSIKKRGIFSYIFGISPNAIIGQQLMHISTLIQTTLPLLSKLSHQNQQPSFKVLVNEIYPWLENLTIACHSTWSFHRIDTVFLKAHATLQHYFHCLKEEQGEIVKQIETIKQSIQKWIKE